MTTTAPVHSPMDRYRFTGEFHYFRVPKRAWSDRLRQVRDLGFEGVSIYVPWNWHEPTAGAVDFTGRTLPERDLHGALEAIAAAGLECIYRPGPFITNEWRDGGIPAWLWRMDPSIVALDAAGRPAGEGRPYPALTYGHPGYAGPATDWLARSIAEVAPYMRSAGGPIVHLQLDDEPSYWQQLGDPLALDYNPYLVAPVDGGPSRYAAWLLARHGSLDAINAAHRTRWRTPVDVAPPRDALDDRAALARSIDWLDFKLHGIDGYVAALDRAAKDAGYGGPVSMIFPYLRPLQASKFAEFAREHLPDLELTNECYISLFSSTQSTEQKVAHVIACHETYHMWRGARQGPAFTMELQGSNSSFLPSSVMELLYAVTLARGIRGFNVFMLVGGENPPGYELGSGRGYDLDAPIALDGHLRGHAAVLARQIRVTRAIEPVLLAAEPLRDTWIACYTPYESAALVGGGAAFADVGAALDGMFSNGEFGLGNANSLSVLLTLANVSWGMLDLERSPAEAWDRAGQLWLPGLAFLDASTQRRICDWVRRGGDLIILPAVPVLDARMEPSDELARLLFEPSAAPLFPAFEPAPTGWSQVRLEGDGAVAVQGSPTRLAPPADATAIAWSEDGAVVGFRRPIGAGSATVLGFRLQYHPIGGPDQFRFVASLVERSAGPRAAVADMLPVVALELSGSAGGVVCVVNPVELPAVTRVTFTPPGSDERAVMPIALPGISFAGRGARLLPVGIDLEAGRILRHATGELLERRLDADGSARLVVAATPPERVELALGGTVGRIDIAGGRLIQREQGPDQATVIVVEAERPEVTVTIGR